MHFPASVQLVLWLAALGALVVIADRILGTVRGQIRSVA